MCKEVRGMKELKAMMFVACLLFFVTAAVHAAPMDDLGVTIKMIDADDMKGVSTELHLPAMAADVARKQAEDREGRGLSRANEARNGEQGADTDTKDGQDEEHASSRDTFKDSHDEMKDSHAEIHDETKEFQEEVKDSHPETPEEIQDGQDNTKDDMGDKRDDSIAPMAGT